MINWVIYWLGLFIYFYYFSDLLIDWLTGWLIDWLIDWSIDWLIFAATHVASLNSNKLISAYEAFAIMIIPLIDAPAYNRMHIEWLTNNYRPRPVTAVLNLLRLEDQILSFSHKPPLKIVPWIIAKIGQCAYILKKFKKNNLWSRTTMRMSEDHWLRTAGLGYSNGVDRVGVTQGR